RETLRQRKHTLVGALEDAGMEVLGSDGTYYVINDIAPLGLTGVDGQPLSGEEFCRRLPGAVGVAGIPVTAFVNADAAADPTDPVHTLVRWTFCKNDTTLATAAGRLKDGVRERLSGGE
ncbi:MAG: aminotransferase, partial [Corynebacterium variabile]|nr:aminotransferase [Corynebacterium variabile]